MSSNILALGGTGLIGRHLASLLPIRAASPSTGVDAYTGTGLTAAFKDISTVIELTNPRSFDEAATKDFYATSTANALAAARAAGVAHYIVLSVVGADRLTGNGYMTGKLIQESLIVNSGLHYTILRATQFHEFLDFLAQCFTNPTGITVPSGPIQTIAASDVAAALADIASSSPANTIIDLAGPEAMPFAAAIRRRLAHHGATTPVNESAVLTYFGAPINAGQLVPAGPHSRANTTLESWAATNR